MHPSDRRPLWTEGVRAALLCFALTLVLAYPLSRHPGTMVLPMSSDTDLYVWTLQWDVHALARLPLSIFDANIFYPFRHTLAYSENLIGSAMVAAPVLWISANPVLALNAVALLSCILCGAGAYVLARRVGIGPPGATLAGIIFAFAPPRFFRLGQLHLTTIQWVPFCLASVHAYLDSGQRRDLWWACLFFVLQVLTSAHGAVFTVLAVLLLVSWRLILGEPIQIARRVRDFGVPGVLSIAIVVLVLLPYLRVQREMGLRRSLDETIYFSPNPSSFLASPTRLHTFLRSELNAEAIPSDASAFLFPGYLPLAFAAIAVWRAAPRKRGRTPFRWAALGLEIAIVVAIVAAVALTAIGGTRLRYGSNVILSARDPWRAWIVCAVLIALRAALVRAVPLDVAARIRAWRERMRRWADLNRRNAVAFYGVLCLVAVWLSLGPPYLLYRLVYDWPGISFIRVPSRFTLVALLALAILAAAGFERLTARLAGRARVAIACGAAFLLVAEFFAAPLNAVPYSVDIPDIDRWLATQTPVAVAEVPLASPRDVVAWARRQSLYMLHSTAHWHRTIHGYSGLQPAFHDQLYSQLVTFPRGPALESLASIGVIHIVVHSDLYPPGEWPGVHRQLERCSSWLTLERVEGAGRVYSLHRPSDVASRCLQ